LGLNYIRKVFLFFLCMPYEQRYCDAKSDLENFKKRHYYYYCRRCCRLHTVAISVTRGVSDQAQVFASLGSRYLTTVCGGDDTHREGPVYVCALLFD